MMKKIKLFPAPHVEIRIHVSDEMIADYRECYRLAKKTDYDGKDCNGCSWYDAAVGNMNMCEFNEMLQLLEDNNDERKA